MQLKNTAEALVWHLATERYAGGLMLLVEEAIKAFKRHPGLDGLTRIYTSDVGADGLKALAVALDRAERIRFRVEHGGIEIRSMLRSHLTHWLRGKLMDDGHATARMRAEHFAEDLGV